VPISRMASLRVIGEGGEPVRRRLRQARDHEFIKRYTLLRRRTHYRSDDIPEVSV
jgi:hypothetical protein